MRISKILFASIALMALASCGGSDEKGSLTGEPIAAVAPPAGKVWTEVAKKTPEGGYLIGNPDAKIKLIEFGSLTCHVCADFATQSGEEFNEK